MYHLLPSAFFFNTRGLSPYLVTVDTKVYFISECEYNCTQAENGAIVLSVKTALVDFKLIHSFILLTILPQFQIMLGNTRSW